MTSRARWARRMLSCGCLSGAGRRVSQAELELIRLKVGRSVRRLGALIGLSRFTWHRRSARYASRASKGRWPGPVRDAIEGLAVKYALRWPAWGTARCTP